MDDGGTATCDRESQETSQKHHVTAEQHDKHIGRHAYYQDRWFAIKRLWAKTGVDLPTFQGMIKGALPPTIALAAYQSESFANIYTTSGYFIGVASVICTAHLPRASFLQRFLLFSIGLVVSLCSVLLSAFCCVKARDMGSTGVSSSRSGGPLQQYDSSAAAVAGAFLFLQIYILCSLRASFPVFQTPGTILCIFINTAMVYAPQFATMAQATTTIVALFRAIATGGALSASISLFVFPANTRGVVFEGITSYINTLRRLMAANMDYIESLQTVDMFCRTPTGLADRPMTNEAERIKATVTELNAIHAKLGANLTLAKREIAIGHLGPDDLTDMFRKLRELLLVAVGYSSLKDVFERITESYGWRDMAVDTDHANLPDQNRRQYAQTVDDWHRIAGLLKGPFQHMTNHIDDALAHILITLNLQSTRKAMPDLEATSDHPDPGKTGYTEWFKRQIDVFHEKKGHVLRQFYVMQGLELPPDFFDNPDLRRAKIPEWYTAFPRTPQRQKHRRELYIILFIDSLLESLAIRVHDFCVYADEKARSGKLHRTRLIVPGYKRIRKSVNKMLIFKRSNSHNRGDDTLTREGKRLNPRINLGTAYSGNYDPEHLPASTQWQKFGNHLRKVSHALGSTSSIFGMRVAFATMCVAVIGLLSNTRTFYIGHRLFWAQNIISIAMVPSAAQSLFDFIIRIAATTAGLVASLIIWYIVDGSPPGAIVLYGLFGMLGFWFIIKKPRFMQVGLFFNVTNTLIIGYQLQALQLGIPRATANGQLYEPIYLLGPYRLGTISAGLLCAYIWTVFPFPLSEHSSLRHDLGTSLYLLANYNSIMDETVCARIRGDEVMGDSCKTSARLQKVRNKVYAQSMETLASLRDHTSFLDYDVTIGGPFPRATYAKIIDRVQSIFNFIVLLVNASKTFSDMYRDESATPGIDSPGSERTWLQDFRRMYDEVNVSSRECTTILSLLSGSVTSGKPLPPYLKAPQAYGLAARMEAIDRDILNVDHILEPGFSAFACLQIGTKCIEDDIRALLRDVKQLVGEMDFSFYAVDPRNPLELDGQDLPARRKGKNE